VYGLLPESEYACAVVAEGTLRWAGALYVGAPPPDLPQVLVSGDPARASLDDGFVMFNHWKAGTDVHRAVIVDAEGRVRWYQPLVGATGGGVVVRPHPDGFVAGGGRGMAPSVRSLSGDLLAQATASGLLPTTFHHEALVTPAGWLVGLRDTLNTASGELPTLFTGFQVEAYDPILRDTAWTWSSQLGIDQGVLPVDDLDDPYHANAVVWTDDDPSGPSVWVSLKNLDRIVRIDQATWEVTLEVGVGEMPLLDLDGQPLPDEEWFYDPHGPDIDPESGTILVHDNGGSRPTEARYSRVVEVQLAADGSAATETWSWTEPGWFAPVFGSAVRLANGNVMVASGHCQGCVPETVHSFVAEIDPDTDEVLWRLDLADPRDQLYRAYPVEADFFTAAARR
jgi:hypothetical protein